MMIYKSKDEAQAELNKYYSSQLVQLLSGQIISLIPKEIKSYILLKEKQVIEFYYSLVSLHEVFYQGVQCINNNYIMKLTNENEDLYISYTSNGLLPSITDIQIVSKK